MKVLWTSNIVFPEAAKELGLPIAASGGWLLGMSEALCRNFPDLELGIVSCGPVAELKVWRNEKITHFVLPLQPDSFIAAAARVTKEFAPEIVHINGTELEFPLHLLKCFPKFKYVLSIQGMQSICARYCTTGISEGDYRSNPLLRLFMRRSTRLTQAAGEREQKYLINCTNVIGRTRWDRAHVSAINPECRYFHCDEILRKSFFESTWEMEQIQRHTLFFSQCSSPIKGFHLALKALALIRKQYPDVEMRVAGMPPSFPTGNLLQRWNARLRYSGYIVALIQRLGLEKNVIFTGPLSESQMADMYRQSHVFLLSSTIENSPNSLGEAQCLGTPAVCSYVGGVPDMAVDGESALLVRAEEYEMMANAVMRIFADDDLACELSKNGIQAGRTRHDADRNARAMYQIYQDIETES